MSAKPAPGKVKRITQAIVAVVVIVSIGVLTVLLPQEFAAGQANGKSYVGFNAEYEMIAELPPSIGNDLVVPMTLRGGEQAGLYYQGEQPLQWKFYGGVTFYTMHAIGRPGETIQAVLVRMSKADFHAIYSQFVQRQIIGSMDGIANPFERISIKLNPNGSIVDYCPLEVVGP